MRDREADVCWAYRTLMDLATGAPGGEICMNPGETVALNTLLDYATQPLHRCGVCSHLIQWINADTGGWWAHLQHPKDDHDAVAVGPVLAEEDLC